MIDELGSLWNDCPKCYGVGYIKTAACDDCSCTGGPETMACMSPCPICMEIADAREKALDDAMKAICPYCKQGHGVDENGDHRSLDITGLYHSKCPATAIRALKEKANDE